MFTRVTVSACVVTLVVVKLVDVSVDCVGCVDVDVGRHCCYVVHVRVSLRHVVVATDGVCEV